MPEISNKYDEKKINKNSAAKIAANNRYLKKALENGKYKQFSLKIDMGSYNIIDTYSKNNNISKAEIIRKLAEKIEAGEFEI